MTHAARWCVVLGLVVVGPGVAGLWAQAPKPTSQPASQPAVYPYLSFLPKDYEAQPARRYPLILFLHGAGERGEDLDKVKAHGPHKFLLPKPDQPFVIIVPQCPTKGWWSAKQVLALLDQVQARYRIDPDRVYLTGLSMGGFGSWDTVAAAPGRFAAVVPICGGGNPKTAAAIKDIPIWVFHGAKDKTVPLQRSQEMVDALTTVGGRVKFTIYPDAAHDSWTATYKNPELYEWLLAQKRGAPAQPASRPAS